VCVDVVELHNWKPSTRAFYITSVIRHFRQYSSSPYGWRNMGGEVLAKNPNIMTVTHPCLLRDAKILLDRHTHKMQLAFYP